LNFKRFSTKWFHSCRKRNTSTR